jgi:phosphoribosylamine--glycine ligase
VMAAPGYPEAPVAGSRIGGLAHAAEVPGLHIFHAGTRNEGDAVVAAGGRVLNLVGTAPDLLTARATAYAGVDLVDWPEGFCRSDIGLRALR